MVQSYVQYFHNNYFGNRAPVHIGHHFSQMNGGAYWKAMQRIARYVRKKPDVICGTYKELLSFIEKNKHRLDDYQAGNFDKPAAPVGVRHGDEEDAGVEPETARSDTGKEEAAQSFRVLSRLIRRRLQIISAQRFLCILPNQRSLQSRSV